MDDPSIVKKISARLRVKSGMCPNGHSLMSDDIEFDGQKAVTIEVRKAGLKGKVHLNPFYGRFEFKSSLSLKKGDVIEAFCPQCGVSLAIDTICRLCNIPMFAIQLPDGGQVESCPKAGCHNHSLKIVDLDAQLERMYVDETKFQM